MWLLPEISQWLILSFLYSMNQQLRYLVLEAYLVFFVINILGIFFNVCVYKYAYIHIPCVSYIPGTWAIHSSIVPTCASTDRIWSVTKFNQTFWYLAQILHFNQHLSRFPFYLEDNSLSCNFCLFIKESFERLSMACYSYLWSYFPALTSSSLG